MGDKAIHARLVVHDFPNMSKLERRKFIAWLRHTLNYFEHDDPKAYTPKFTARLFKR